MTKNGTDLKTWHKLAENFENSTCEPVQTEAEKSVNVSSCNLVIYFRNVTVKHRRTVSHADQL